MNSSKSVLVLAPRWQTELVQELLDTRILPSHADLVVLLPPGNTQQYDNLTDKSSHFVKAQFFPSPDKSFFAPRHLKWLRDNLRSSENNMLLIIETPYQDPATALIALTVLILSGKDITLLFATPEAAINLDGQGFSERWISQKLNFGILAGEFSRIFWFLNPWSILYFLMFGGLIIRQSLAEFYHLCRRKLCIKKDQTETQS